VARPRMSESERLSLAFYAALGAEGLAARASPEWDGAIVARLTEMLPPGGRVLDVGCGYGRISIPLAASGYRVEGIDLSPLLLEAARTAAEAQGLEIEFRVGSMTKLPYSSASFDAVLCLWSAFHELLQRSEQVAAIAEMWRVTAPGGFGLVEGPRADAAGRITQEIVAGLPQEHYRHDEGSFRDLCDAAGIERYRIYEADWAGRQRLFLRLERSES
jgi:2-polyprenyl-3-methyl-5-hydroxy-6-metoxy-1,4-benzoquinol methylase